MAVNLGIKVETFAADWRTGADIAKLAERLAKDKAHEIKAVLTVHNETATGMVLPVADIRRAIDEAKHPALLLSDTISSLASHGIQDGRLGHRRDRGRQPEGPDAAHRHVADRRQQQGHRSVAQEQDAASLLELGDDERPRAAEVRRHRARAHVLRPAGIAEDARGRRPRRRVRPPCSPGRSDPRRRARLGCRRQGPAALRPGDGPALQLGDGGR